MLSPSKFLTLHLILHPWASCQSHFYSGRKMLPHFAEEADDQRDEIACPRSHSLKWKIKPEFEMGFKPIWVILLINLLCCHLVQSLAPACCGDFMQVLGSLCVLISSSGVTVHHENRGMRLRVIVD